MFKRFFERRKQSSELRARLESVRASAGIGTLPATPPEASHAVAEAIRRAPHKADWRAATARILYREHAAYAYEVWNIVYGWKDERGELRLESLDEALRDGRLWSGDFAAHVRRLGHDSCYKDDFPDNPAFLVVYDPASASHGVVLGFVPDPAPKDPKEIRKWAASNSDSARWEGDHAAAERVLVKGIELLDQPGETGGPAAAAVLDLVELRLERGAAPRALEVLNERLTRITAPSREWLKLELERVRLLGAMGRHNLAIDHARTALRRAAETFGEGSHPAALAGRRLALALVGGKQDLDEALKVAERVCPSSPESVGTVTDYLDPELRRTAASGPVPDSAAAAADYLDGTLTLLRVLLERGATREALSVAERAEKALTEHRTRQVFEEGQVLTEFEQAVDPLQYRLWGLRAEALAALGVGGAIALYEQAIQQTEIVNQRTRRATPHLKALREGLTRARRAGQGNNAAQAHEPVPQPGPPTRPSRSAAPAQPWPRRAVSGIVTISNIDQPALDRIVAYLGRPATLFGPIRTLRDEGKNVVTVMLDGWDDPFDAKRAERNLKFVGRLSNALRGIQAARRDSNQGAAVEMDPWWSIEDLLPVAWWAWPSGQLETWRRELFPKLPGWQPGQDGCSWLGSGIHPHPDGANANVAPSVVVDFVPDEGLLFRARGTAEELDRWFDAFALATGVFPAGKYRPLIDSEPKPERWDA